MAFAAKSDSFFRSAAVKEACLLRYIPRPKTYGTKSLFRFGSGVGFSSLLSAGVALEVPDAAFSIGHSGVLFWSSTLVRTFEIAIIPTRNEAGFAMPAVMAPAKPVNEKESGTNDDDPDPEWHTISF